MFTQKISMDCTKEQYEKFLKEELLKMGYIENGMYWGRKGITVFTNAANGITGGMLDIEWGVKEGYGRTYLGSFNAPLFLALAAMTDKPKVLGYGEYITDEKYKPLRRNDWGKQPFDFFGYHKSTKEEIIALFSEKKCNHNTLENKIDQLNEKGKINISFNATELESEMSRLIDELWDSIEKSHIDALKSKGYKILKPKTWEEV